MVLGLFDERHMLEVANGIKNRDDGMEKALQHANSANPEWSTKAAAFLRKYISYTATPFMAEDVRMAAINANVPEPPSKRAWGPIILKARKDGLIKSLGTDKVSNPRAHRANAGKWIRVNN